MGNVKRIGSKKEREEKEMTKEDIVKEITDKLGGFADLSPFERVLIQYVVEVTMSRVVKK